jgi:hypothetical protein
VEGETAEGLAERLEKVLGAKWKDIHNDWKEDR